HRDGDHERRLRRNHRHLRIRLEGADRPGQPLPVSAGDASCARQDPQGHPLRERRHAVRDELRDAEASVRVRRRRQLVHGGCERLHEPLQALPPARDDVRRERDDDCGLPDVRRRVSGLQPHRRLPVPRVAPGRLHRQQPRHGGGRVRAHGQRVPSKQHEALTMLIRLRMLQEDEQGFALVIALAVTVVFSLTVITVVESAASNSRSSDMSKNRVSAYDLAEAGIANVNALLAAKNPYDQHLLHPQGSYQPADCAHPPANPSGAALLGDTCSPLTFTLDGGTATVWGWLNTSTANWTITSTGQATRNAFASVPATKTLTVVVHIRARASQQNVTPAWNYVFVKDTTSNVCNITLDQTTALTSSLYTEGNLCFKNSSSISETNAADPVLLEVRGKLVWLTGASKGVGQSSPLQEVTSATIGGGCATGAATNTGHTRQPPPTARDYFYVKAGGYTSQADQINSPSLTSADWDNYYQTSSISRLSPCNAGGPAGTNFDNDTTRNTSLTTPFNLTPGSSYTCQTK